MGASLTIYCLEKVTDYIEFERLSHDLMVKIGYQEIEPLGKFKDKGRDAIHVSISGETTIFAYSVREDWRAKLAEDAAKIKKHRHSCDKLCFVTNADVSASERDEATEAIRRDYGWSLELYGLERLRILLEVSHPELKRLHPQIFPPNILEFEATSTSPDDAVHVFISYSMSDTPFVDWLARKLASEGYSVWCEHNKTLGMSPYPNDADSALRRNVAVVLAIYSSASVIDPDATRQRAIAFDMEKQQGTTRVIPIKAGISPVQLDQHSKSLDFISFQQEWLPPLEEILDRLAEINCPKPLLDGKEQASKSISRGNALIDQPERVYSNCLPIIRIPAHIKVFSPVQDLSEDALKELQLQWSFRRIDDSRFLSLQSPSQSITGALEFQRVETLSWQDKERIHGVFVTSLVSELLRKAMIVKVHSKGLHHCDTTNLDYFPLDLLDGNWLKYSKVDGSKGRKLAAGQRTFWRPQGSQKYRYHLAPEFTIAQKMFADFSVLIHLRLRFTDEGGNLLTKRTAFSRRKHLCRDWWNDDWFNRILAICQFLSDGDQIIVGEQPEEQVIVSSKLVDFSSSVGIDEQQVSTERTELSDSPDGEKTESLDLEETSNG